MRIARIAPFGASLVPVPSHVTRRAGRLESSAIIGTAPRAGRRGIVPLIAAAVAAGVARTGFGLFNAHKQADRRRATIYDAYNRGKARLDLRQHDVREGTVESLGSRGLAASGGIQDRGAVAPTPVNYEDHGLTDITASIRAAMERKRAGVTGAAGPAAPVANAAPAPGAPHTLGEQQLTDLQGEQLLEQNDMLAARDNGIADAGAEGTQQAIDSIAAGINTGTQVYGMGQQLGAMGGASASASAVAKAGAAAQSAAGGMLPGAAGAGTIRGAFGIDPITAQPQVPITPGPALSPAVNPALNTVIGDGQSNYDFRRY